MMPQDEKNQAIVPAEWAPHERCVMAFCSASELYSPNQIDGIQYEQVGLAKIIAEFEPVTMLVNDEENAKWLRRKCGPDVDVVIIPHYDIWTRDTLPTVALRPDGRRHAVSWNFNVWGEKFEGYDDDRELARRFAAHQGCPLTLSQLVTEGGALEFDGEGTVLTTRSSLLNPNRNPGLTESDAEREFEQLTGARKVIWLPGGTTGITDGHVDGFARFVAPGVVLAEVTDDPEDPDYEVLLLNAEALEGQTDATGRQIRIVRIKRPRMHILGECSEHFSICYANFYIANGGVIMPKYGDPIRDIEAREIVMNLFPDRAVRQIYVEEICEASGGIHCATQQIPACLPVPD